MPCTTGVRAAGLQQLVWRGEHARGAAQARQEHLAGDARVEVRRGQSRRKCGGDREDAGRAQQLRQRVRLRPREAGRHELGESDGEHRAVLHGQRVPRDSVRQPVPIHELCGPDLAGAADVLGHAEGRALLRACVATTTPRARRRSTTGIRTTARPTTATTRPQQAPSGNACTTRTGAAKAWCTRPWVSA